MDFDDDGSEDVDFGNDDDEDVGFDDGVKMWTLATTMMETCFLTMAVKMWTLAMTISV